MHHETPDDLDEFLKREEITREEYAEFWGGYWKSKFFGREQTYLDSWILEKNVPVEEEVSPFAAFWKLV